LRLLLRHYFGAAPGAQVGRSGGLIMFAVVESRVMVTLSILLERYTNRRNSLFRLAFVALSVGACSSMHRVPRTAPTPAPEPASAGAKVEPDPAPLFTSRDGAPTSFVASNSDAKTTRVVTVRDGLTKPAVFRMATDYLSQKFTVYVSDPNAGFLMTSWQASLARDGVPELRYRTRIVLRFLGDDWKQLAVQAEANWLRGEEWQVGYDAALLDSATVNLTTRLGKRP
jgi:hypothetical protein